MWCCTGKPTIWELYRRYIVGGIVLLLFQTLLIFGLVRQRARRRKTETELRVSNDRLRRAVEAGKCVGWDWDVKTGSDRWFGDLETMFGIQSQSYYGHLDDFLSRVHPEDRELAWKAVADARRSRKPFVAEFRVLRLDGTVRWVTERGEFYYAANGEAERMLGMAVDITERKLAEEALKKSEEKFSKAFRESPMALAVTSVKDNRYLDINDTYEQMTGWRRDEIIGRTPFDLKLWVDPTQRAGMAKEIQTKGTVRNLEFRFRRKDGEQRDGLASAELIEIEGEPCLMAVVADITERKQIQEQLQISQARLAGIVGSAMDAIIATDAEQNIVLFNTAAENVFGCTAGEAIGTAIDRFIPERFRLAHKELMRLFGVGKVAQSRPERRWRYCSACVQVERNFRWRFLSPIWRQMASSCLPSSSVTSPSVTSRMKLYARASRDCAWQFRREECMRTSGTPPATRSSCPLNTWISSGRTNL